MEWPLAVLLGVLQGLLEWLPVSSEGILFLVLSWLGRETGEAVRLAIWLHLGTLGAAVVYLRDELARALAGLTRAGPDRRLLGFLVVATFLTGLVGGPIFVFGLAEAGLPAALGTLLVGVLLLVTAAILHLAEPGTRVWEAVDVDDGALAGLAQGLAVLPGLSRSGLTLAALLGRGFDAGSALRLSFLMSIPAVAGAQVGLGLLDPVPVGPMPILAAGVAFVVGLAAMDGLIRLARRVRFDVVVGLLAAVALVAGAAIWWIG